MLLIRRHLPTGEVEADPDRRIAAWADLADKLASWLGIETAGLDPDLLFTEPLSGKLCVLTPDVAVRLERVCDQCTPPTLTTETRSEDAPTSSEVESSKFASTSTSD